MSQLESITDLETIDAPWNREVTVQEIVYPGGLKMLRLRIREGRRFTDLELDGETLRRLCGTMTRWQEGQGEPNS